MNIIAVDDESKPLQLLVDCIEKCKGKDTVIGYRDPLEAVAYVKENQVDVAFLDIKMKGMTGIELAKQLKKINPRMNIVFVTGYAEYGVEAVNMHASGYLEKPVDEDDIRDVLDNLLYPVEEIPEFYIRTFGNFDVLYKGKPLHFERSKAKELLACLVDLYGASATRRELSMLLFGKEDYSLSAQDYFSKIYRSLKNVLREIGKEDILVKEHNSYAIDMSKIDCDLKDYIKGIPNGLNAYQGSYMKQYEWAGEFTEKDV